MRVTPLTLPAGLRAMALASIATAVAGCGDDALSANVVEPVYGEQCRYLQCSSHGICVGTDGGPPECLCDVGYGAATCDRCEGGFHRDSRDRCVPDRRCSEQDENPCGSHGTCTDGDGVIECLCDPGYAGPRCTLCALGFSHDNVGRCLQLTVDRSPGQVDSDEGGPPDMIAPPSSPSSSDAGAGTGSSGPLGCDLGYAGPTCLGCAMGFHPFAGACVIDEECQPDSCSDNARCDVVAGVTECICDEGYGGDTCESCATGYHAADGVCVADEQCLPTSCPNNATCFEDEGTVLCECDPGWSGAQCSRCEESLTESTQFEFPQGWPSTRNTCVDRSELQVATMSMRARGGDSPVRLCAASSINQLTTQHVELEAGALRPAELVFAQPIFTLSLRYGARLQALDLEVRADDEAVANLVLPRRWNATVTLALDPPARRITLWSRTEATQDIGIDDVIYHYDDCE